MEELCEAYGLKHIVLPKILLLQNIQLIQQELQLEPQSMMNY